MEDTVGQRADAISILAQNLTSNLGGKEVAVILGDTNNYQRLNSIKSLSKARKIKNGLSSDEVDLILEGLESQKIDGLKLLTPYLAK